MKKPEVACSSADEFIAAGLKNRDILNEFDKLLKKEADAPKINDYNPENIGPNDSPYYRDKLPEYDFSELSLPALQSIFMTAGDKLKEVEQDLIHQFDPHLRIRLFNERSILSSTLSQLESMMIKRKREEMRKEIEDQDENAKRQAKHLRDLLEKDDQDYYKQRLEREREVAFLTKTEADRLIAKGTDSKLKVPEAPKKPALKSTTVSKTPIKKSVTIKSKPEEKKATSTSKDKPKPAKPKTVKKK